MARLRATFSTGSPRSETAIERPEQPGADPAPPGKKRVPNRAVRVERIENDHRASLRKVETRGRRQPRRAQGHGFEQIAHLGRVEQAFDAAFELPPLRRGRPPRQGRQPRRGAERAEKPALRHRPACLGPGAIGRRAPRRRNRHGRSDRHFPAMPALRPDGGARARAGSTPAGSGNGRNRSAGPCPDRGSGVRRGSLRGPAPTGRTRRRRPARRLSRSVSGTSSESAGFSGPSANTSRSASVERHHPLRPMPPAAHQLADRQRVEEFVGDDQQPDPPAVRRPGPATPGRRSRAGAAALRAIPGSLRPDSRRKRAAKFGHRAGSAQQIGGEHAAARPELGQNHRIGPPDLLPRRMRTTTRSARRRSG